MPASSLSARDLRVTRARLPMLALVGVLLASLAIASSPPAAARDWTPSIKSARSSQVYWESVMRHADAQVRQHRKAIREARERLKRRQAWLRSAHERRTRARSRLDAARVELRQARRDRDGPTDRSGARPAMSEVPAPPPPPDADSLILALQMVDPAWIGRSARPPLAGAASEPDSTAVPSSVPVPRVSKRELDLLETRVRKQRRNLQRTRRKESQAWRAVRQARARVSAAKAAQRSTIARREAAERSLGYWILAMETYARGRAHNMSKYRPGIDSRFAWPAHGRISQSYSARHDGLDIVSRRGAPIRAAAFGVIAYIGWNPWDKHRRAFMIVVAHAGGLETLYGHVLPRRSVRVGQPVRQGEVIGYMGNTGNSTGTHLHFEVRRGRTTVNPLGYL